MVRPGSQALIVQTVTRRTLLYQRWLYRTHHVFVMGYDRLAVMTAGAFFETVVVVNTGNRLVFRRPSASHGK